MPIAEILTALKASLDVGKLATDLVNRPKIDPDAVRGAVQEMLGHVVSAYTALGETQHELLTLKAKADEKAAFEALKADLDHVPDGGFVIKKSERAVGKFIPYCPICVEDRKAAIALVPQENGHYCCAIHPDATYKTQAYRDEQQRKIDQLRKDDSAFAVIPSNVRWMA